MIRTLARIGRRSALALPVALAAAMLAGCSMPPPGPEFPPIRFLDTSPFVLDAGAIEIVDDYPPSPTGSPVASFPVTPAEAMRSWGQDRLLAAGTGDVGRIGRFVITEASVTEEQLPRTGGVRGMFTTDQTERYTVTVSARFEVRNPRSREGFAEVRSLRSATAAENLNLNDRRKLWHGLVQQVMNDFDAAMTTQIRQNLPSYLR